MPQTVLERRAVFSPCGAYRYALYRRMPSPLLSSPERSVCFVMLNPSVGDAVRDDRTIKRCIGYAATWGFDQLVIVNLFGFVSTDPKGLRTVKDPVGPENDAFLFAEAGRADLVVAAWGDGNPIAERASFVLEALRGANINVFCLGVTQCAQPRHPLRLAADLDPVPFAGMKGNAS